MQHFYRNIQENEAHGISENVLKTPPMSKKWIFADIFQNNKN